MMKSLSAFTAVLLLSSSATLAGVTISNGSYTVGIGTNGELWDPTTGIGFLRHADAFDPLAQGIPRDSWGVSLGPDGGPWADQSYYGSIVNSTVTKTSAASATVVTPVSYLYYTLEQRYSFVAPNILKISEIIHNGQYHSYFWFQRDWDVDVAPTPFAENSFGPIGSTPNVIESTLYGFEHPDASLPYSQSCPGFCNATGDLGGGIKVDFGTIVPANTSARVDYYYGISQPGQSSQALVQQAFSVGARFLVTTQSSENGAWPSSGGSSAFIGVDTMVPEPASWAMMIAGFGLIGSVLRQRRQTVAA